MSDAVQTTSLSSPVAAPLLLQLKHTPLLPACLPARTRTHARTHALARARNLAPATPPAHPHPPPSRPLTHRLVHPQTLAELRSTAAYQRCILRAAVRLLRPGGTLVFSTCTVNPGENEANVRWLLDSYPALQLVQQEPRLGGPGLAGERGGAAEGGGTLRLLTDAECALVQRFQPSDPLDTIGFFIAKFTLTEPLPPAAHEPRPPERPPPTPPPHAE